MTDFSEYLSYDQILADDAKHREVEDARRAFLDKWVSTDESVKPPE